MAHVYNLRLHPMLPPGVCPVEALTVQKPSVKHLRCFGAHCAVMTLKQGRNKLQPQAYPARLIGYHTDELGLHSNGYIVYYPKTNKVAKVRNVWFNEAPIIEACHKFASSFTHLEWPPALEMDFALDGTLSDTVKDDNTSESDGDEMFIIDSSTTPSSDNVHDENTSARDENKTFIIDRSTPDSLHVKDNSEDDIIPDARSNVSDDSDSDNEPLATRRTRRGPKPIDRLNLLCMVAYELFVPDNVP